MQIITLSGNIGSDAVLRSTNNGDQVLSFSVGVRQGYKQDAPTVWHRCSVWGKRGENLKDRLLKGVKVFVTGELTIGEYQDKPQYDVRVADVDFVPRGDANGGGGRANAPRGNAFDDDSGDVPFMRSDDIPGRRVI
jgi:single-strand DNA-binding protein